MHPARLLQGGSGAAPVGAAGGAAAPAVPMGAAVEPPAARGSESEIRGVRYEGSDRISGVHCLSVFIRMFSSSTEGHKSFSCMQK